MYEIICNKEFVGSAQVEKEGLYYKFLCTCLPPNEEIHRITVSDGETVRDLGICVPGDGKFILTARVPIKYLKGDKLTFTLTSQKGMDNSIDIGEAFTQLEELEAARLQITNGQPEIVIDAAQAPQERGQSQE